MRNFFGQLKKQQVAFPKSMIQTTLSQSFPQVVSNNDNLVQTKIVKNDDLDKVVSAKLAQTPSSTKLDDVDNRFEKPKAKNTIN